MTNIHIDVKLMPDCILNVLRAIRFFVLLCLLIQQVYTICDAMLLVQILWYEAYLTASKHVFEFAYVLFD